VSADTAAFGTTVEITQGGDQQPAPLERIQQRHRATFANERCGTIHLDHGEPSAGGRNGVAFSCVSLLANPQRVQLRLEGAPINHFGRSSSSPLMPFIALFLAP
jgi:hypothetical protein